uniref:EF-hand domain-containing protein n=1 Tax=Haptolina brevifila TaxID=156173 RepID=A0A7S2MZ09_9EUKA
MKESSYDIDGDGEIEENELLDLQRLNYSTPGGMRRGESQVPVGGFSRYAAAMTNKAKAERVRREQQEREKLGSPHLPTDTMVFGVSGDIVALTKWAGSDLVSGSGPLQPLIKENGVKGKTRVFTGGAKKKDAKLKNHETGDRAKFTPKEAMPKNTTPPSGTANKRSPLSGSHSSDSFGTAHDAFTKDEKIEQARLRAAQGCPSPKAAPTPKLETRARAALSVTSRSARSAADALYAYSGDGTGDAFLTTKPNVSAEQMRARYVASAEKLYPHGYNGTYNAVVQETNAQRAEETRQDVVVWKEEIQLEEQKYLSKAAANRSGVLAGRSNSEMAKEEMLRARQTEAEEIATESKRLHAIAASCRQADQKNAYERAARSFDRRYMTTQEMVQTLQAFSPEEASLTPRSVYVMDPASRSPSGEYLKPIAGLSDRVAKENAALYKRIHGITARTDDDALDDAARGTTIGAAREAKAKASKARKEAKAKKLAAENEAYEKMIANAVAVVDADYDVTPLNPND